MMGTQHRTLPRLLAILMATVLAASLSSCGSSEENVVRHGNTSTTGPSAPATSRAPSTATPSHPSTPPSSTHEGTPAIHLTPHAGLHDRQTILVRGTGFTPGQTYTVVECAQKGAKTGAGDCNLPGMLTATADNDGTVQVRLAVLVGPFGANRIVCSTRQPCLISVTQASLSPTEEADGSITFGS